MSLPYPDMMQQYRPAIDLILSMAMNKGPVSDEDRPGLVMALDALLPHGGADGESVLADAEAECYGVTR